MSLCGSYYLLLSREGARGRRPSLAGGSARSSLCTGVVYRAEGQAAEERERPDGERGLLEEARLGRRLPAAARTTSARYCSMTERGIRPRSDT